ncbi:DUF4229 domain-containing protein [Timonella sp. A28]|uniref:DUF4229 domain-containing protein n=1 Tax=Timonella sp. A28 TaxID=3442640 RepID=UPI003EB9B474
MALLKYTLYRIGIVLLCAVGLQFVARGALLWILAFTLGMLISYVLLGRQRAEVTAEFEAHKTKRHEQFGKIAMADADYEDSLSSSDDSRDDDEGSSQSESDSK